MFEANRRIFLQSFAVGIGSLAASQSFVGGSDGHAAGYDVSAAEKYLKTIPRKTGDPVIFTASLNKGAIKATSGGWAREVTIRVLPIAGDIAGAHLFMNAGGARVMHWHNSAEWAYVIDGHCQITVVDPEGAAEIANLAPDKRVAVAELSPSDCAYIPRNCGHCIQNVGPENAEIVGVLDSSTSHENYFSDWLAKAPRHLLANNFGIPEQAVAKFSRKRMVISAAIAPPNSSGLPG
jgi:oxalate decarboxylase